MLSTVFSVVGLVVCVYWAYSLLMFFYRHLLRGNGGLSRFKSGQDTWAVITGGSDGIGKVFAFQLAKKGFNILLLSRTQSKLADVATEIENKYNVSTDFLAVDFSKSDIYEGIRTKLEGKTVGILVNNVGVNYEYPKCFADGFEWKDQMIVDINVGALVKMTRMVLPGMIARKKGGIINLSSFTGVIPSAMLATYSGSKAFVTTFSQALAVEYAPMGISVLSVTPGLTVSAMSKRRKPNYLQGVVNPGPVVSNTLSALGVTSHHCPHILHAIIESAMKMLPLSTSTGFIYKLHKDVNRRAKRKAERAKQT